MTIYQLLGRENIYGIIEQTLKEYYSEVHGINADVRLSRNRFRNAFVVYPRIGVIISRTPTWSVMKHVYADFNVQGSIMRKFIAWSYITLCWCTFGLLGSRSLYISDKSVLHRNISIMPCNRKIRIFDFTKGYVDAILKVGYPDNYLKKEIDARTRLKYQFIPGIEKTGERWYREVVLDGSGLVRTSPDKYEKYCNNVIDDIHQLYIDYGYEISADDYVKRIETDLQNGFNQLSIVKNVTDLSYLKGIEKCCLDLLKDSKMSIPITLSHGDLQTGNIIVDDKNGRVTIYDWETFGERSIWFDCSRLLLFSARKEQFIYMAMNINKEVIKDALLVLDENKNRNMQQVMAVLILEDMKYRIDEILSLPEMIGAGDIAAYENKLKEIAWLN